jgi:glutamate dehydrogenase
MNGFVQASTLYDNPTIRKRVLEQAIPPTLLKLTTLDAILARVPEVYTRAIFGAYLGSKYVYKFGRLIFSLQYFVILLLICIFVRRK